MRIHKKKQDTEPVKYFLSEMLLYRPFTDESELGSNDDQKCIELYLNLEEEISHVKSKIMPFISGIEEARYFMEEAAKTEKFKTSIGDFLDPQNEQDNSECLDIEEHPHPDFIYLDPDTITYEEKNLQKLKRSLRQFEPRSQDELLNDARRLDTYQKKVLNIAINFAHDIVISKKGMVSYPSPPLLMVHGVAGSGKSTVIKVISHFIHHILRKEGDDIDCPYVILSAFTGSAASNINGQTLHTLFSFNFGSGYQSLSDKNRDLKRALYKNLKVLIIDEISLVDADMLYKIDLRLREITQKDRPFGNVAIFAFGDMMQIKPVKGRYIMQCPKSKQFEMAYEVDSLWHKFDCIVLEKNHRQGDDKSYADMLNRIRIGEETEEDIAQLKSRIRKENDPEIKHEKDALYIFGTNKKVNHMNKKRLNMLSNEPMLFKATCLHKTIKDFKPSIDNAGNINNTPFQMELKIKIGAKVMLTYNIDTSDGLTNGARGEVIGTSTDNSNSITKLIVKFENIKHGEETRRRNPEVDKLYPGGTPIEKINFPFSISKSKSAVVNTANVIQFPLKLAFASTAHKIQGATIQKPMKMIISVTDIWAAALVYVMLSRICAIWQLYILDEFDPLKMYPSIIALKETERLRQVSTKHDDEKQFGDLKISSLNCRSLKKHFQDICSDNDILTSDIICCQETWIDDDYDDLEQYQIEDYRSHFINMGRGKGIAIYHKQHLWIEKEVKEELMQLAKVKSDILDIIVLYKSHSGNMNVLEKILKNFIDTDTPTIIVGDFNVNFLNEKMNITRSFLKNQSFVKLVNVPTHIEGSCLDQALVRDVQKTNNYHVQLASKYYTDHKAISLIIRR